MAEATEKQSVNNTQARQILTKLVGRDEVLRFLAVAEAVQLPALLVGPPGTGKTKALTDYAKSYYRRPGMQESEVSAQTLNNSFILETDEGTRSGDVKGRLDLKKLLVDNEYHVNSEIAKADFLLINEIDKAMSSVRNAFLSVMNERIIFNGSDKVACQWKVFVASCNKIPQDEVDSPFWDRFVLKFHLNRVSKSDMQKFWKNETSKAAPNQLKLVIPTAEEIRQVVIKSEYLDKFMQVCYDKLTDRTLGYVPKLTAAVSLIYRVSVTRALIKVAEMLTDFNLGKKLASLLEPAEVMAIRNKIEMLGSLSSANSLEQALEGVKADMAQLVKSGKVGNDTIEELTEEIAFALESNPLSKQPDNTFSAATNQAANMNAATLLGQASTQGSPPQSLESLASALQAANDGATFASVVS